MQLLRARLPMRELGIPMELNRIIEGAISGSISGTFYNKYFGSSDFERFA